MKVQLIKVEDTIYLQYASGTTIKMSREEAHNFLMYPENFLDDNKMNPINDNTTVLSENDPAVLFYIDDTNRLIIQDILFFRNLCNQSVEYLTVDEYAELHGKKRSIIVRICREGRLPGAKRRGSLGLYLKTPPIQRMDVLVPV